MTGEFRQPRAKILGSAFVSVDRLRKVTVGVPAGANGPRGNARPVEPKYPLLAKQMNVQGSVALRARIDKEGSIQDLQVLSGPDILSAAAQRPSGNGASDPITSRGRRSKRNPHYGELHYHRALNHAAVGFS